MAGISGVNGIDEETLYYQYLINHNSASTMLNALSGSTSDDDSLLSGLSSLSGLSGSSALSGLSGTSGLSGVSQDSSFAAVLQSYLSKAIASQNDSTQDAQIAEKLSNVLQEAAKSEDTSSTTYKTVQELYTYFTEKLSGTAASLINGSTAAQSTGDAAQGTDNTAQSANVVTQSTDNTVQSTYDQLDQAALAGQEYDFSSIDRMIDQMFSESTPLS